MSSTLKNTIIYVLLGFLAPAVNFILIPIYTKYMAPTQYGIITLATVFQTIITGFIGIGVAGSYSRYYYDNYKDKEFINQLFDTCLSIFAFSTLFVCVFLFFLGDSIFSYFSEIKEFTMRKYGWWILIVSLMTPLQAIILSQYRNKERADIFSVLSIIFFLSSVFGIFTGVVILKKGALGSIAGRGIGVSVPVIIYILYIYSKRKFKNNWSLIKPLLNYGYPLMFYLLLSYLYKNIDKLIVSKHFDSSILGLYGFAMSIAVVTEIFLTAMQNTFYPKINKLMVDAESIENSSYTAKEIKDQFQYIFIFMLFSFISLIAFSLPGVQWFIDVRYHSTMIWLPLMFISFITRVYYVVYSFPIFFHKKTRTLIPITIITLIFTVIFSIVLIPFLGIYALIVVNFLSNAIQTVVAIIYSKRTKIFNDYIYSFKYIHIQYVAIIIFILLGYALYDSFFNYEIQLFMIYNLIGWLVYTVYLFTSNRDKLFIIKDLLLSKLKAK
ncbi:MAG: oligosaccharide flippase family protein [Chitinophagales bacterium]|nr:oligosaccharide flippase family protein [Chitinophagales bacterium]